MRQTLDAIRRLETMVLDAKGIILRYGAFYGPGTAIAEDGDVIAMIRGRKFPIVGSGAAVWSFIHIDDAAKATHRAIAPSPRLARTANVGRRRNVDDDSNSRLVQRRGPTRPRLEPHLSNLARRVQARFIRDAAPASEPQINTD
jgi:nucleoside-diphosphate-sugar epimerase